MMPFPRFVTLAVALAAMLAAGCSTFKTRVTPPPPGAERPSTPTAEGRTLPAAQYRGAHYFVHQVRWEGETPGLVAEWYTGSAANSRQILLSTPNLHGENLRPGDVLFIPAALVRMHTPLPAGLVRTSAPSGTPRPSAEPRDTDREKPPEPFGPRTYPGQETVKP